MVERFLRERRGRSDPGAELVAEVIAWMLRAAPRTRVDEVARAHGVSTRTLQRVFRANVGVSPKWVLKRYRLHDAAERIADGTVAGWASLARELGYFDQAHFISDFRALVGMTPSAYAAACSRAREASSASEAPRVDTRDEPLAA